MGRWLIFDTETDSLNPSKVWCAVAKDIKTDEVFTATIETGFDEMKQLLLDADRIIGHNMIQFDWAKVIRKLWNLDIPVSKLLDTLVLSRMESPKRDWRTLKPDFPSNLAMRHSLEAWGVFLGFHKGDFNDFDKFCVEMLTYCKQDVDLTHLVFNWLTDKLKNFSRLCIRLEHDMQHYAAVQEYNGFFLNKDYTDRLHTELLAKKNSMTRELISTLPPSVKKHNPHKDKDYVVTPRILKNGQRSLVGITKNPINHEPVDPDQIVGPFSWVHFSPFNPGSNSEARNLLDKFGWKPVNFNKPTPAQKQQGLRQGSALVSDEDNLATLPSSAPDSIRQLALYYVLANRVNTLEQWLSHVRSDSRVHGVLTPIGANTHRCSHSEPNMANVPKVLDVDLPVEDTKGVDRGWIPSKKEVKNGKKTWYKTGEDGRWAYEFRSCWGVPRGKRLVGCDASSIQLRIFAHYIADDDYSRKMVEDDIHSIHAGILGVSRSVAKTFIYAYLLGAGDPKIGSIVGGDQRDGKRIRDLFDARMPPGLKNLKKQQELDLKRGFMTNIDGRRIETTKIHKVMGLYLQGGEQAIMKTAYIGAMREFERRGWNDTFIVDFVHDEFQCETPVDKAEETGFILKEEIRKTTGLFNLRCQMDGDFRVGLTWADTH